MGWNKGQPRTPETRAKIAAAQLGKRRGPRSPEARERIAEANRRKAQDPVFRANLSAGHTGRVLSPEHRASITRASTGRTHTPETRAKMSAVQMGRVVSPEARAKLSAAHKASGKAAAHRRAMWDALGPEDRRHRTAAGSKAGAAATKTAWAQLTPEERSVRVLPMVRASQLANPSPIELVVRAVLDALGVSYEAQYPIGRYVADIYVPSHNLVVECDGHGWHGGREDHDARRDTFMRERGHAVLRLPEAAIRDGSAAEHLRTMLATG
jgi:very-short-patch-repair endonuclease